MALTESAQTGDHPALSYRRKGRLSFRIGVKGRGRRFRRSGDGEAFEPTDRLKIRCGYASHGRRLDSRPGTF